MTSGINSCLKVNAGSTIQVEDDSLPQATSSVAGLPYLAGQMMLFCLVATSYVDKAYTREFGAKPTCMDGLPCSNASSRQVGIIE